MPSFNTTSARVSVPESRFGVWFLGTGIWIKHVLKRAFADIAPLIKDRKTSYPVILDVGCGWGWSFKLLNDHFSPVRMIGVDVDKELLSVSAKRTKDLGLNVDYIHGTSCALPVADQSVDMVFCHQTFHHLIDHDAAIKEFHRVLKPGGILIFAESTRAYIHSWLIRFLFRHPMEVQKSATEYINLIRNAGFHVAPTSISLPYLWWSRKDLGILQNWFRIAPPADREETLVNLVAVRE